MLVIWLTLPASHTIRVEDILELIAHFHLGTVTKKACRCTTVNDVMSEDAGELEMSCQ
jgi:hypothetical protein